MAIQLIALQDAVGYYYPPENPLQTILLFYNPAAENFTEPLFLLFHEAGHSCQWRDMKEHEQEALFFRLLACDRGPEKAAFEDRAWDLGQELFKKFVETRGLNILLCEEFTKYGRRCVESYLTAQGC